MSIYEFLRLAHEKAVKLENLRNNGARSPQFLRSHMKRSVTLANLEKNA